MTLAEIIGIIRETALAQPAVNQVIDNDVLRLNKLPDAKYGVFAFVQGQHRETLDGMITYVFSFIYVDRLVEDGSNEIDVQSVALRTLSNVIRSLEEQGLGPDSWNFTTFNQRFNDMCAGAFCNVELTTEVDYICVDEIE